MNETILNGLLNLFAVFASLARVGAGQARQAVNTYLSSHFGIRSHTEYLKLYDELQGMYGDPDFDVDRESVIMHVCTQLKPKLMAEEQLLLLLRFMEFAYTNQEGFADNRIVFSKIATIFSIQPAVYESMQAFVTGHPSPAILTIGDGEPTDGNQIQRRGLEGKIRVLWLSDFDRLLFTYQGNSLVFMNDLALTPRIFYSWQRSSVIKSPLFLPVYYSDILDQFNRRRHNELLFLTGRDLDFHFRNSENGLHNFSFNLESGQLAAIMGGSGVGKSTLLSLLNGNITPQRGNICMNGHPLSDEACKQQIGFVPQDDLLIEELTVYQNLWYTAKLCFANLSDTAIAERVNSTLNDLDLLKIRSLAVGSPMNKTISGGQRKRLNIALELIREPAILYLDEPTSGLSSSDSEKVIMLLKEQTHRGKLVVVNIHQPSSEIYKLFDRLWLLDTGGYPIYDGNPIEAITYFKRMANYTDQEISVCSTCGNVNPELILNIIDAKKIDDTGNQTPIRKLTAREWHELYLASRPAYAEPEVLPLPPNNQQKPSVWKQFLIFLERNIKTKLTNKQYLGIALLEAPVLAVIVALLTRFEPDEGYTLLTNKNLMIYIFMAVIVATFIGMTLSAEEIIKDRTLLKRERFLRLSRSSYLTSKIFYLFSVSGIQSLLFILVGNALIGIGWEMFFFWWATLWATSFLANLTGLVLSQSLNSIVAIYITIPLLLIPQILLCGVVVKFDDLNKHIADRNVVPLIGDLIPSRWGFEALTVEQFGNNAYNAPLFRIEKEKYRAQYYQHIHVQAVRDLIQQLDLPGADQQKIQKTLRNELAVIREAAHIESHHEEPHESFLIRAEEALKERSNNFTALLEKVEKARIDQMGTESYIRLKKEHHNTALGQLVQNSAETHFYREAHHRILPKVGQIYMKPESNIGRAPFYSYEKKLFGYLFSTFSFNLFMLGTFGLLVIIVIFAEFPGKYINKNKDY